jgi:hypothetical protein
MVSNLSTPSWVGLVALVISPLALLFGYLRYRTKTGIRIHGAWGTMSTISCEDTFVHSVILENQKDRASTIFAIYLRVGYNYYIEIEDFRHSPLILKAFETYHQEYDPIDFYAVSMKRILLDDLLRDPTVPKRLFLSTSQGKYRVPKPYKHWDPMVDFFSNHAVGVIHPTKSTFKGKAYGSNVIFLVELKFTDGSDQLVPIHARDYKSRVFKGFRFTEDSLASKQNLEDFLKQQQTAGKFTIASFEVHNLKEWRDKLYDEKREVIKAKKLSRFDAEEQTEHSHRRYLYGLRELAGFRIHLELTQMVEAIAEGDFSWNSGKAGQECLNGFMEIVARSLALEPGEWEGGLQVFGRCLGFLQANDVGPLFLDPR